jgi:hypothetical protein
MKIEPSQKIQSQGRIVALYALSQELLKKNPKVFWTLESQAWIVWTIDSLQRKQEGKREVVLLLRECF